MRPFFRGKTVICVAAALAVMSCALLQGPSSAADTALVMPVTQTQEAGFNSFGHIGLHFLRESDKTATLLTIDATRPYNVAYGLLPGKYSISEATFVYDDRRIASEWNPNISFTMEPGKITVLDRDFVQRQYYNGSIRYMNGQWDPLTQDRAKDLLTVLWKDVNFSQWRLSDSSLSSGSIRQALVEVAVSQSGPSAERHEVHYAQGVDSNNRGLVWTRKADHEKAMADFDKAIELSPKYSEAYKNRAAEKTRIGDSKGVTADSARATELQANKYGLSLPQIHLM